MAPQIDIASSPATNDCFGSYNSAPLLTTQLYRSALHRQSLLLDNQEDLHRIVLHNGLLFRLKEYLKETHLTRLIKKRRPEEDRPDVVELKVAPTEIKRNKIIVAPRVNRKRQSDDNITFAVEKKKTKPNEKKIVEEKMWKAEEVDSKKTEKNFEDPFGMDDLFAQLQIKQS